MSTTLSVQVCGSAARWKPSAVAAALPSFTSHKDQRSRAGKSRRVRWSAEEPLHCHILSSSQSGNHDFSATEKCEYSYLETFDNLFSPLSVAKGTLMCTQVRERVSHSSQMVLSTENKVRFSPIQEPPIISHQTQKK